MEIKNPKNSEVILNKNHEAGLRPLPIVIQDTQQQVEVTQRELISYWQPTEEELAALNEGGYIQLNVVGQQHPPVWLGVITKEVAEHVDKEPANENVH